jgi:hypothetical protein
MALLSGNSNAFKSVDRVSFAATAGQTTFTLSQGYNVGEIDVFLNGIKLVDIEDYSAINGTTIILNSACTVGDTVQVVSFNQFLAANTYTKTEADTRYMVSSGVNPMTSYLRTPNYGVSSWSDSANASLEASVGAGTSGVGIKAWGRSVSGSGGELTYVADTRGASGQHIFYGYNGSSLTQFMKIDNGGRVFKPSQVCFHVSNTTNPTSTAFTGESTLLRFENVNFNIGGGWNSSTYRFTAPVAGKYYVYGQTRFDNLTGYSRLYVSVNGGNGWWSPGLHNITPNQSFAYWSSSVSGVLNLAQGEYIELRGGGNNGAGSHQGEGSFGAYLLG